MRVYDAGQLSYPPAESAEPLILHAPYRVDLGALSVLVLNFANACDQADPNQTHFDHRFKEIAELLGKALGSNVRSGCRYTGPCGQ